MYTPEDLIRIRKENNLTQEELANKLGVTRELLVKMEGGSRSISRATTVLLDKFRSEQKSEESTKKVHEKPITMDNSNSYYHDKYVSLLEKSLEERDERIRSLLQINSDLKDVVQANLKRVVKILLNHEAAMEARQQVVLELLATPEKPFEMLLDNVYNIEGRLIRESNETDNFLQTGSRDKRKEV